MRARLRAGLAMLLLTATLALIVFMPVTHYGRDVPIDTSRLSLPILLSGQGILAAFLLSWWLLRSPADSLPRFLWLGGRNVSQRIRAGVAAGMTGWALTVGINITLGALFGSHDGATTGESIPDVVRWLAELPIPSRLAIVGAAMTVEEGFFRGFLQPRIGAVASTLLFALGHFSYGLPFLVIGVVTISFVLAYTFEKEGDLLPCIVAHGVFDAIQLLIILPLAVRSAGAS